MLTSSCEGFFGERRIGTCKGSFQCCNKECPFIKTSHCHQPNRVSWRNVRSVHHVKVCAICDHIAERLNCSAKKLFEYDYSTQVATVYHLGQHKCTPPLRKRVILVQHPQIQLGQILRGSAKEVGLRQIVSLIDAGDMDAAEKEDEVWLDRWRVKRQLESMDPQQGMDHNSFDAMGIVKQKTDKKDPFYIYRIGNRNLGGGTDYVFKSSRKMAQMALHMDVDGEPNILQMENAYFDATHTWVYGFKSLGLWLIHPAMKKILRLASMELRSENNKDIALFFSLFNEKLSTVSGVPNHKFNPRDFVCDEAGANYKTITELYGASRGQSAGVRNSKDRAQQIKVAEDFVNILDHEEDVLAEAEQGNKPSMFIPKSDAKHRAPKKRFTTKKPTGGPQRKVKKAQEVEDLSKKLEDKLAMAMVVCDSELTSTRRNKIDNPPMLIYATWRITKCRGCKKSITDEDKASPHSFVLHRHGVVGYFNKLHNNWFNSEQNIHFHMNMDCVCKRDSTVEKRHVSCNDEVFCRLSEQEMVFLHVNGYLKPIVEKKME